VPEGLAANFIDDALYGAPTEDWLKIYKGLFAQMMASLQASNYESPPPSPAPPAANAAYVGAYTNDFFGDVEVVEHNGGLAVLIGPEERAFPMTHYDRDVFTFETIGENASGPTGMLFTLDRKQKSVGLTIDAFNVDGEGVLARK
jgi:hypothetical protein